MGGKAASSIAKGTYTASNLAKGAAIGGLVNGGAQLAFKDPADFKLSELFSSAAAGGLTLGQSLRYSLLVNTEAAFMTAKFNGQNPTSNAAGAALGTLVGFKTENFLTSKYINNQVNALTVKYLINGNVPLATATAYSKAYIAPVFSAGAQEATGKAVDSAFNYLGTINYLNSKK